MKQQVTLLALLALSALVQLAKARFSESIYSTYSQIENAVLSDPKLVFKLREAFHPVITERHWQVDGVQVVPIKLCVNFNPEHEAELCGTNTTLNPNTVYCNSFQWTNSYLLNLLSPELLLAMDPVVYLVFYSEIVRSSHRPSNLVHLTDINVNSSCVPSFDDFLSASALFLSWSKLYATENSEKLIRWHSKYQGYIAKWHTYFEADPHFKGLTKPNNQTLYIQVGLWISFVLLNLLIPVAFIKRGGQLHQFIVTSRNKNTLRLILLAMSIVNTIYFILMIDSHVKNQLQPHIFISNCYTRNYSDTNSEAIFCHCILGMLITKVIILPAVILIEFITAIIIPVYATRMNIPHSRCSCATLGQVLALGQLFIFVQIILGLISIPLLIMILISPAQSMLIAGAMCIPILLLAFILMSIPCTKSCKHTLKSQWITLLENIVGACLVTIAFLTYYGIVSYGASMNSIKGYVLSLIPTVPISIFVWKLKRKLINKNTAKHVKVRRERKMNTTLQRRRASLSTEEEVIFMSDTSADEALSSD